MSTSSRGRQECLPHWNNVTRVAGLLALLLLVGGCAVHDADFVIRSKAAGPALVGFGAQMNAYQYYGHNWGPGEGNESNIGDFERKVMELGPQHVRIFVQPEWWEGGPDIRESMMRTIGLAQRAGATINLTLWHGPHFDAQERAHDFVVMVSDLIRKHGFSAIKYVTIQNEPNSFNMDMQRYNRLYRALDEELRSAGLRQRVKIIGGDLLSDNQAAWFRNLSENLSDVLDGYSVHMYQDYRDRNRQLTRVSEVSMYVGNLPKRAQKPVYLMEFGLQGYRKGDEEPGKFKDGTPLYDVPMSAMLNGWRIMEALNRGYVAMVWWDLVDVRYDKRRMYYGLMGEPAKGWPLKPGYHLMRLFTHTCEPGWRAMEVEGFVKDVVVSAVKDRDELSVYVLNRSQTPRSISVGGFGGRKVMHQFTWNGRGDGKVTAGADVDASRGFVQINAPAESITAITTEQMRL